MDQWEGKVAVVTGASVGIGAAICTKLVESGLKVVGLARRKHEVDKLAQKLQNKKGKLYSIKTDVSQENEILEAFSWIVENVGPIHILINNAAISHSNDILTRKTSEWKEVFDINLFGLGVATREAIKIMKNNNIDGQIIQISSIAGRTVLNIPSLNVYCAAKFAVNALTETVRQELDRCGSKIKISTVSPGLVKTELFKENWKDFPANFMETKPSLKSEDVANAVAYVLSTPPDVRVHDIILKPVGENF
ncbi:hypothetical protein FQR65_LT06778 [Abscondita terminalis]|nr:hypothetical protein FQR65_LT06778 [Abscondita terminalis]